MKIILRTIVATLLLGVSTSTFSQIIFDANIESGSLKSANLIGTQENISATGDTLLTYKFEVEAKVDPINPVDVTLEPSSRWFHFKIKNCKEQRLNIRFTNSDPAAPVYSYDGKNYTRFTPQECPDKFTIEKTFENDSVFISYFVPYTYSYLAERIKNWNESKDVIVTSIGKSTEELDMPLLVVTSGAKELSAKKNGGSTQLTETFISKLLKGKKIVYIHGRVHPSETPASWNLDGIIDEILSNTQYGKSLREQCIFFILPFTNPDGVVAGCSRSNNSGINLEINWARENEQTAQEVKNMKRFLNSILSHRKIDLVLNMHSQIDHSITYWVHNAESTSDKYFRKLMLLCSLTTSDNPYFNNDELSYSKHAERYMEGWFYNQFEDKTPAITFETPYSYYHHDSTGTWVSTENLREMGAKNNLRAVSDFLCLTTGDRIIVTKASSRNNAKYISSEKYVTFNGKVLATKDGATNASVSYKAKNVSPGNYDIFLWMSGRVDAKDSEGLNRWIKVGELQQDKYGKAAYTYQLKSMAENPDAMMLLKK